MERLARHGARACMPRRFCSPATSTRPLPCSPRRPRSPPRCPTPIRSLTARPSWPCWRWIVGGGRRRPSTLNVHSVPSMSIGCTTTPTSVLAFAGAARLAVHRGDLNEAERQLTQAMRARPSLTFALPYLAVRVRLQLAKVYWALGDLMTARHLLQEIDDVLLHRPALGTLVDEVAAFRQRHHRERARSERPARRRSPRRSCGCSRTCRPTSPSATSPSGCSCPATPSTPRSARSIESWASHRVTKPCNERPRLVSSAGRQASPGELGFDVVGVVAERQRQLRGRRDHAGKPDDREGRRPARRRSRRPSPPHSPPRRPARRRTGQRHRRRPTRPGGPAPASSDRALHSRGRHRGRRRCGHR